MFLATNYLLFFNLIFHIEKKTVGYKRPYPHETEMLAFVELSVCNKALVIPLDQRNIMETQINKLSHTF